MIVQKIPALAVALVLLACKSAVATPISVPNFSFQNPDVPDGGTTIAMPDWNFILTGGASGGIHDPLDAMMPGTTGDNQPLSGPGSMDAGQAAFITLPDSVSVSTGRFVSAASLGAVANDTTYTLTVAVGDRIDAVDPLDVMIELLVNGNPVASATTTGALLTDGIFTDLIASFTTGPADPLAGGSLLIRLTHSKTNVDPATLPQVYFDNVRLDADVVEAPEPASGILMCLAGLGLTAWRAQTRRKRRLLDCGSAV